MTARNLKSRKYETKKSAKRLSPNQISSITNKTPYLQEA
jgi:hypothetical protein